MLIEISFLDSPRMHALTDSQKWIYLKLWGYSVQQRRETHNFRNLVADLAHITRKDARIIPTAVTTLQHECLIEWDGENRITVCGVKKKHPNLKWKDDGKSEDLDPPKGKGKGKGIKKRNKEKEKEKETVFSVQNFVNLYHELLPFGRTVAKITKNRKTHIQARLKEYPDRQFWIDIFTRIGKSPFLRGEIPPSEGYRQFKLSIDFISNESNVAKILEGAYDERNGKAKKLSYLERKLLEEAQECESRLSRKTDTQG